MEGSQHNTTKSVDKRKADGEMFIVSNSPRSVVDETRRPDRPTPPRPTLKGNIDGLRNTSSDTFQSTANLHSILLISSLGVIKRVRLSPSVGQPAKGETTQHLLNNNSMRLQGPRPQSYVVTRPRSGVN